VPIPPRRDWRLRRDRMIQVKRLLGFIRPYSFRLVMAVLLMVVVGASEGITALLIKPIFDRVLTPGG